MAWASYRVGPHGDAGSGAAGHQRHPGPGHGRAPPGPVGPPGHGDGARAAGPRAVDADPALRRDRPRVARPRPLRAVRRPRVDPPLLDAPPHRVPTSRSTTSRSSASGAAARPATPSAATPPGVEVTTGPLGQGFANAVGHGHRRALAAGPLRRRRRRPPHLLHRGDGDLSEGISHEAASLAGHLGLGRLICVYDDNHISIDGPTELALADDAGRPLRGLRLARRGPGRGGRRPRRPRGRAPRRAAEVEDRPSLVDPAQPHRLPVARPHRRPRGPRLRPEGRRDPRHQGGHRASRPTRPSTCPTTCSSSTGPPAAEAPSSARPGPSGSTPTPATATVLDACLAGPAAPGLGGRPPVLGAGRVGRHPQGQRRLPPGPRRHRARARGRRRRPHRQHRHRAQGPRRAVRATSPGGRQIYFGVREHGMAASMNGMALHGGVLPVGGTFLVFSDYCRGGDPPRRPVPGAGHLLLHPRLGRASARTARPTSRSSTSASLRAIPGLRVIRPADANETAAAWRIAVEHDGPTALLLTRQDLPVLEGTARRSRSTSAATCSSPADDPDLVLVGTGSEVARVRRGRRAADRGGPRRPGRVAAVLGPVRRAGRGPPGRGAARRTCRPWPSRPAPRSGGTAGPTTPSGIDRFGASAPGDRVLAELGLHRRARGRAGPRCSSRTWRTT